MDKTKDLIIELNDFVESYIPVEKQWEARGALKNVIMNAFIAWQESTVTNKVWV